MNDKNTELFFGDDENVVVTLTDEDGQDVEAQIMAAFEIEELGTEYLMAVVLTEDGEEDFSGEIHALKYEEDENGEPEILPIEEEEEMEIVSQAMQELLENGMLDGVEFSDEEDEDEEMTDDNYLDDIGTIFPGVSIDKE